MKQSTKTKLLIKISNRYSAKERRKKRRKKSLPQNSIGTVRKRN